MAFLDGLIRSKWIILRMKRFLTSLSVTLLTEQVVIIKRVFFRYTQRNLNFFLDIVDLFGYIDDTDVTFSFSMNMALLGMNKENII